MTSTLSSVIKPVPEAKKKPERTRATHRQRARHRHSLDCQELLSPGEIAEFRIRLGPTACRFLKGHRIRLEITSSDFPNHDRNHNTGGNDLAEVDLAVARQTIFHGGARPSRLILPAAGA